MFGYSVGYRNEVVTGFGVVIAAHLVSAAAAYFVFMLGVFPFSEMIGIGGYIVLLSAFSIWQFTYVGPLIIWARKKNRRALLDGIIVAASLTFLQNAACDVLVFAK